VSLKRISIGVFVLVASSTLAAKLPPSSGMYVFWVGVFVAACVAGIGTSRPGRHAASTVAIGMLSIASFDVVILRNTNWDERHVFAFVMMVLISSMLGALSAILASMIRRVIRRRS